MSKYNLNASQGDLELEKALNELSSGANGIPVTMPGNVYYVVASADSNYTSFYKDHQKKYSDGTAAVHSTLSSAYSAVTPNRNDVILISANAAHAQTSILDVSKSRVHFVGMGLRGGAMGLGARARITMGVTTSALDIAVMKNTGVGNTFRNLKFDSANTKDESLYAVAEGGEYTIYENCQFYKSTDLNETGAAEVLNNGDSAQWIRCSFGDTVNQIVGAVVRPCMLVTRETITGKVCRDNVMVDCLMMRKGGDVANRFIYGANATDVERMFVIKNTIFFSNPLGAATPALAVDFGAAQTTGAVLLDSGCAVVDVAAMGATGKAVYVMAPSSPTYATSGLSVAA